MEIRNGKEEERKAKNEGEEKGKGVTRKRGKKERREGWSDPCTDVVADGRSCGLRWRLSSLAWWRSVVTGCGEDLFIYLFILFGNQVFGDFVLCGYFFCVFNIWGCLTEIDGG